MGKVVLDQKEVRHIAKLANLKLTEKEVLQFQKQLSEILTFIDQLNELNTKGVEPTSQVTGLENVFRPDKVTSSLTPKEVLSGAQEKEKGFIKTKAVFE